MSVNKIQIHINVGNENILPITISYSLMQKILKEYIQSRMYQIPPEYIAKELNTKTASVRSRYEKLCTPTEYVNLKKKIHLMEQDIKLLKLESPTILKIFTTPGETYTHPDLPSIKIEKIPLLECVIKDEPPEKHPLFQDLIHNLRNPSPSKLTMQKELVPYSSSFDSNITKFECLDENLRRKIIREISLGDYVDEKTKWSGKSYLWYLTPNQMANAIYTLNKSVMQQVTKEYLDGLYNNPAKSDDYIVVSKAQNKALEFEKNFKLGKIPLSSIPLLSFDSGIYSITLPEIIMLSAYADLSDKGKTVEEISIILKFPRERIIKLKEELQERWNKKRRYLEDYKIDKYIEKRDSTCYKIAKIIKENNITIPLRIGELLKKEHGNLGLLGKSPDSSIISYINKINNDGGCSAYIKWFEEHYEVTL